MYTYIRIDPVAREEEEEEEMKGRDVLVVGYRPLCCGLLSRWVFPLCHERRGVFLVHGVSSSFHNSVHRVNAQTQTEQRYARKVWWVARGITHAPLAIPQSRAHGNQAKLRKTRPQEMRHELSIGQAGTHPHTQRERWNRGKLFVTRNGHRRYRCN